MEMQDDSALIDDIDVLNILARNVTALFITQGNITAQNPLAPSVLAAMPRRGENPLTL